MIAPPLTPIHTYHYIAAARTLASLPHSLSLLKMPAISFQDPKFKFKHTNQIPRSHLSNLAPILPPREYSTLLRLPGAHLNAMECFPLFAAAMLAGKMAGVSGRELNIMGQGMWV